MSNPLFFFLRLPLPDRLSKDFHMSFFAVGAVNELNRNIICWSRRNTHDPSSTTTNTTWRGVLWALANVFLCSRAASITKNIVITYVPVLRVVCGFCRKSVKAKHSADNGSVTVIPPIITKSSFLDKLEVLK